MDLATRIASLRIEELGYQTKQLTFTDDRKPLHPEDKLEETRLYIYTAIQNPFRPEEQITRLLGGLDMKNMRLHGWEQKGDIKGTKGTPREFDSLNDVIKFLKEEARELAG